MKLHITLLCVLASTLPIASQEKDVFDKAMDQQIKGAMGRSFVFINLSNRSKRILDNRTVNINADFFGLHLQFSNDAKVSFPDGKSWVETPEGNSIPILTKQIDAKKLPEVWQACVKQAHIMRDGNYKFIFTIEIDGQHKTFDHVLRIESKEIEGNKMSTRQLDLEP